MLDERGCGGLLAGEESAAAFGAAASLNRRSRDGLATSAGDPSVDTDEAMVGVAVAGPKPEADEAVVHEPTVGPPML